MKITALLFGFVIFSIPRLADAAQENAFATAAAQAGIAADAKQLSEIHERLQFVLNCLEGAKGQDYKEPAANPCSGKGALETLPEKSANRIRAGKAITLAQGRNNPARLSASPLSGSVYPRDPNRRSIALGSGNVLFVTTHRQPEIPVRSYE